MAANNEDTEKEERLLKAIGEALGSHAAQDFLHGIRGDDKPTRNIGNAPTNTSQKQVK